MDQLVQKYDKKFAQNKYYFKEQVIRKLYLKDRNLFVAQRGDLVFLSESSLGVEETIRAYEGYAPRANLSDISLKPGHILMNTPALDHGIRQLAKVAYHPLIKGTFRGTKPTL